MGLVLRHPGGLEKHLSRLSILGLPRGIGLRPTGVQMGVPRRKELNCELLRREPSIDDCLESSPAELMLSLDDVERVSSDEIVCGTEWTREFRAVRAHRSKLTDEEKLDIELLAFERMKTRLKKCYPGCFVAIYRKRVIGVDRDGFRLAASVEERARWGGPIAICRVPEGPDESNDQSSGPFLDSPLDRVVYEL